MQVREPVSRTWALRHSLGTRGSGWGGGRWPMVGKELKQLVQKSGTRGNLRKEEHGNTFEVI